MFFQSYFLGKGSPFALQWARENSRLSKGGKLQKISPSTLKLFIFQLSQKVKQDLFYGNSRTIDEIDGKFSSNV